MYGFIKNRDISVILLITSLLTIYCFVSLYINSANIYHYFQTILFLTLCYMICVYIFLKKNIYYIDPILLFLVSIVLYELPKLGWYIDNISDIQIAKYTLSSFLYSNVDYSNGSLWYLIHLNLCCFIILSCGLIYKNKNKKYDFKVDICRVDLFWYYTLICSCAFFIILYMSKFDIFFFLSARQGNDEAKNIRNGLYVLTVLVFTAQVLFIQVYENQDKIIYKLVTIFLFILMCFLSYIITGSRGFSIYSILSVLIYFTQKKGFINWKQLLTLAICFIITFSLLGIIRNTNSNDITFDSIINSYSNKKDESLGDYQMQLRDELIFDKANTIDNYYFDFYISPLTAMLPKNIIGDLKKPMIDGVIARDIWGRYNIGLPVNSNTEAFLSFGALGIIFFIPFGLFLNYLFYNFFMKKKLISIYLPLMILSQTFLTSKLFFVIQIVIVISFLFFLSKLMSSVRAVFYVK